MIKVIKKDGLLEDFDINKVIVAVTKSAERVLYKFTPEQIERIKVVVTEKANSLGKDNVSVADMHKVVELALDDIEPKVAKSYRDYRNYKSEFVHILDKVFQKKKTIEYMGDNDNANSDSALVSTQRSLIYNELNGELYK